MRPFFATTWILSILVVVPQEGLCVPRLDGRIVGGENAKIEDYPHQVSLLLNKRHLCGGSIIGPQYIVTAAHCTDRQEANSFSIRAGSSKHNEGGVAVSIKTFHQHPSFSMSLLDYDISILELSSPLTYGSSINKVKLPAQDKPIEAGTNSSVTGWGSIKQGGPVVEELQVVRVPIVGADICRKAYSNPSFVHVTDRMICAGNIEEGGKDSCQGDSGGPLVISGELVGIVSWGAGCARPKYPGVYTRVPAVRSFIKDITGI